MKKKQCKNESYIHEKQYVTHQSVSPCLTCVYKRLKCVNMVGNCWMLKFYELFSLLVCWLICKYFFGVFTIIVFCVHLKLTACACFLLFDNISICLADISKMKSNDNEFLIKFLPSKKWKYVITLSTYCSFNATSREQEKKHVRLNWKKKKLRWNFKMS